MRALIQRVRQAEVIADGEFSGAIGQGLMVLLGVAPEDDGEIAAFLAERCATLRIFEDEAGNIFGWATTAKSLEVGETYTLRGTIKSHDSFRNIKTTWLTRCNLI